MATQNNQQLAWVEWIKAILIAIILAFLLRSYVFSTSIVEGESMYPALDHGERIIFNKFVYLVSEPKRGDIIIIQQGDKNYVKRIIGLPNETIELKNKALLINNIVQTNQFVDEYEILSTGEFGPLTIPDQNYFVLGDNRAISKDSRNGLGLIHRKEIIGRSEVIIYPFKNLALTR